MKAPRKPADESERLEALRSLELLDTPPEERFDRLTRLAKRLFDVPIALVSLIDSDRQWFKSRVGLDAEQTGRNESFCGHAILSDEILLVTDTANDERFVDNPLVIDEPRIRFYAGCPLKVASGRRVGTLCLIDREPRDLSDDEQQILWDLAAMAEQELLAVQLAGLDELTGLSNRRGFLALASHAFNLGRRMGLPASLLCLDLDDFKPVNDRFGHAEGDAALRRFASVLQETCRDCDVLGRLGGDEFVAYLADTDPAAAQALLVRLGRALRASNEAARHGYDLEFSAGIVAMSLEQHASLEDMLREADRRMYEDKRGKPAEKAASVQPG